MKALARCRCSRPACKPPSLGYLALIWEQVLIEASWTAGPSARVRSDLLVGGREGRMPRAQGRRQSTWVWWVIGVLVVIVVVVAAVIELT